MLVPEAAFQCVISQRRWNILVVLTETYILIFIVVVSFWDLKDFTCKKIFECFYCKYLKDLKDLKGCSYMVSVSKKKKSGWKSHSSYEYFLLLHRTCISSTHTSAHIPVPGDLMGSYGLCGYQTKNSVVCMHTCRQNSYTHKKKNLCERTLNYD